MPIPECTDLKITTIFSFLVSPLVLTYAAVKTTLTTRFLRKPPGTPSFRESRKTSDIGTAWPPAGIPASAQIIPGFNWI